MTRTTSAVNLRRRRSGPLQRLDAAAAGACDRVRPLDDRTRKLLLDWLEHRRRLWLNTANLHLLINNQTATKTSRASNHWVSAAMRGQDATLERLRVDRQLEWAGR